MHDPHYRNALRFGWQLTMRNKSLWIYGLFAVVLGQMGIVDIMGVLLKSLSGPSTLRFYVFAMYMRGLVGGLVRSGGSLPIHGWIWLLWIFVFFIGVFVYVVIAAIVSQGALISASASAAQSARTIKSGIIPNLDGREWHSGVTHFWRVFSVNVFRKIIFGLLAILVACSAWTAIHSFSSADTLAFLAIFFLALIVGVVLSFFVIYAASYIVVEEYPFWDALRAAWSLFSNHLVVSCEVGIIFLFLNVLVAVIAVCGFFVFLIPTAALWLFAVFTANHVVLFAAILFFGLFYALFLCALGASFTVFSTSVWTYLFVKMHHLGIKSAISRLMRWRP